MQRRSTDSRGSPLTTRQTLRGELAASCTPTHSGLLSTAFHPSKGTKKKKKKDGSLQPCESQANDQQFGTCPCPIHSFRLTRIVCIVTFQSFTVQAQCDDNRDTGPKHGVVMSGGQRSSRLNTGYGGPQDDWLSLRLTQFSHQASATLRGVDLSSKSKSWHRARF